MKGLQLLAILGPIGAIAGIAMYERHEARKRAAGDTTPSTVKSVLAPVVEAITGGGDIKPPPPPVRLSLNPDQPISITPVSAGGQGLVAQAGGNGFDNAGGDNTWGALTDAALQGHDVMPVKTTGTRTDGMVKMETIADGAHPEQLDGFALFTTGGNL